jgi:hypothetical protein
MAWIKRNLFFFIGGLVALGLLGAASYYNYTNWSRNTNEMTTLEQTYETIKSFSDPASSPGDDKINKIQEAKDQEKEVLAWLNKAKTYFQPITPIPADSPVTSESFSAALRRTIDTLQHEAGNAVGLPPEYGFSFEAQRSRVTFSPGSLDLLAAQLGEVKTITEILYAAGVNDFDGIQRARVSDDDASGPQSDYVNTQTTSSGPATLTPYVVTFRSFSPEIAQVFAAFANSPHGFVIKSFNVQPASTDNSDAGAQRGYGQPGYGQPGNNLMVESGGLVTVLKEKLLRVTMEIEIVKLSSKN